MEHLEVIMDDQNGAFLENVANEKEDLSGGETMFFDIKVNILFELHQIQKYPLLMFWILFRRKLKSEQTNFCYIYINFIKNDIINIKDCILC